MPARRGNISPAALLEKIAVIPGGSVALYAPKHSARPWHPIATVPRDRSVEVQVNDQFGTYSLTFPCRLTDGGWINANSMRQIEIHPTHWREPKPFR